jgi:hypothetical protein
MKSMIIDSHAGSNNEDTGISESCYL